MLNVKSTILYTIQTNIFSVLSFDYYLSLVKPRVGTTIESLDEGAALP